MGLVGPYWVEFQGTDEGRPVLVVGQVHSGPHWALLGGVPELGLLLTFGCHFWYFLGPFLVSVDF